MDAITPILAITLKIFFKGTRGFEGKRNERSVEHALFQGRGIYAASAYEWN
jgi:hypothetical protein